MGQVPRIVQTLQEQNDSMERFANAQARLLNVSSIRSFPSGDASDELHEALTTLHDVQNRLRQNMKQLKEDEFFCKLYPKHLALSQRVIKTIATNPSWHANGLASNSKGITEVNTVGLASLRASIEQITEAERARTTA